jgi:CDP-glycerol glycerophosphotransferase (TagB/SpsB family)
MIKYNNEDLIFLDSEEFKKLKLVNQKNIILLDYPPKDFPDIELENIEKYNIEEFYPDKLLKNLDIRTKRLFDKFYKRIDKEVIYRGINLFSAIKNYLYLYFIHFTRQIEILDYIIRINNPKKIIIRYHKKKKNSWFLIDPELSVRILKEICSFYSIPVEIHLIKEKTKFLTFNPKKSFSSLLGFMQNFYFKINFLKKNGILFVGGKDAYLSILKHLKSKQNRIRCNVNPGLSFFSPYQDYYLTFWNKPTNRNVQFLKSRVISKISDIHYHNYSFYKMFSQNLDYLYDSYFKIMIRWIDMAYDVQKHINAVITTNDTLPLEQIIIRVLKKNNKKSYVIQHGYTTLKDHFFSMVKNKLLADKMFLWGKSSKQWIVKQGVKGDNLIVTGSPKFDKYFSTGNFINIKKKFNIPHNKKIILFVAPPTNKILIDPKYMSSNKECAEIYRILFNVMKDLEDYFLIVKLHPSDGFKSLPNEILKTWKLDNVIITEDDLASLLKQSDLVITTGSTVSLEAMFFKKPIIILNFFNKAKLEPFADNGMCVGLNDKTKLKSDILKTIKNKDKIINNYYKYFEDYALADGKAYQRISEILLKDQLRVKS